MGAPVTENRVGGFEYAKVDVVFCGGEGDDELLKSVSDGDDGNGKDARR